MRYLALVVAGLGASAYAQRPSPVPVAPELIEQVRPTGWVPLDASGAPMGALRAYEAPESMRAASWKYAFDSMNSQANSLPATGTTPPTLQSLWVIPGNYRAYMWANDITALNTGTAYGLGKGAYIAFHWNPAATTPASGSQNFAAKIYTARKFDATGDGPAYAEAMSGVMVTVANLSVGTSPYKAIPFDLSLLAGTIPLPGGMGTSNAASVVVELGTYSGSTFAPFNPLVICSPLFGNMQAPGEPRFPGTNISRSTDAYWADDASVFTPTPSYTFEDFSNTANSSFPFCELYSGDTEQDPTPANRHGIIQPAIALLLDQNTRVITGTLTFLDQVNATLLPKVATMEIYDSSGVNLLSSQTVSLGPSQTYTIGDPSPSTGGTYVVRYVQNNTWLSKRSGLVNTTGGLATTANLTLRNGDANMSTEVDPIDIDIVVANFGRQGVDGLNGNLDLSPEVDPVDIDLVIANFGMAGE